MAAISHHTRDICVNGLSNRMSAGRKLRNAVQCPVCCTRHLPLDRDVKDGVFAADCQNCGYFFKFKVESGLTSQITLTVNGTQYTASSDKYSPTTSLNSFLRAAEISTGTKYMCTEGGCGTCMVQAKLYEPISDSNRAYSINSCLCPLFVCDGWDITTVEGIDSKGDNSVPARLAKYNGSQCGFCSPGQVVNMHSLLEFNNDEVTMEQVEDAFDCVICRCTGYRSILDAMKSFAVDHSNNQKKNGQCTVDIEEIGKKLCHRTGSICTGSCHGNQNGGQMKQILAGDTTWFKPTSVKEVIQAMKESKGKKTKLVFGNTGFGVYKELGQWMFENLIDLRGVREMYGISFDNDAIIGANVSLTQLQDIAYRMRNEPSFPYFQQLYETIKNVASHSIRNLGSWAGNLMLKHLHPEFPSDVYNILSAAEVKLMIVDFTMDTKMYEIRNFVAMDMTDKFIIGMVLPGLTPDYFIRTYRATQRNALCQGHVNAGIGIKIDRNNKFTVKEKPVIVYGGISAKFDHAVNTEKFLAGKQLSDHAVLQGALNLLATEVVPDNSDPVLASSAYRKSVALGFFYRFILDVLGDSVPAQFRSGGKPLVRPLSSGIQTYGTDTTKWPDTQPMTKVQALAQTSGLAQYINDIPVKSRELSAAFVVSTVGNATLQSMDPTAALKMPGVLKFLTVKDIPGVNSCYPPPFYEELLCSGKVNYTGQPLGIIITGPSFLAAFRGGIEYLNDSDGYAGGFYASGRATQARQVDDERSDEKGDHFSAESAAKQVKVVYNDIQPPILTIEDAIKQKSFHPKQDDDLVVGNAEAAISSAARMISGSISVGGQSHFHMETQVCICTPTEDGMDVDPSTQGIDFTQQAIAQVLSCPESSLNVRVKRLGGAYGGKISRNLPVSTATALAAHIMKRPVRMAMDFHTNMETLGKRFPHMANYQVGFTEEGLLRGMKITYYADCGSLANDNCLALLKQWADNAYFCPNWHLIPVAVKTNKTPNAACRSPGSCPAIFIIEAVMEHVAKSLGKDPDDVKTLNLYNQGQTTPNGNVLTYCNIRTLMSQLEQTANISQRKQEVAAFNKINRWKKKGISVVPMKFALNWKLTYFNCLVNIYSMDGSVSVSHGGIESGQGINTKVLQTCAYELEIPIDMVTVKASTSMANADSVVTGGSVTTELNCRGVIECCQALKNRMAPVKAKMVNPTWKELVQKCASQFMDLSARYYEAPTEGSGKVPVAYNSYGVTATEVELDVLSGQNQITRVDMLYDCGESINPEIDIGQAEGAFVMGLGYYLTEELIYNPQTGALATNSTWNYKPPMHKDTPIDFRVHLLKNAPNPIGVLRSKAVGEPPLCMSCSALFAVKHAVEAYRKDIGQDTYFPLNGPATVEKVHTASMISPTQFVITARNS